MYFSFQHLDVFTLLLRFSRFGRDWLLIIQPFDKNGRLFLSWASSAHNMCEKRSISSVWNAFLLHLHNHIIMRKGKRARGRRWLTFHGWLERAAAVKPLEFIKLTKQRRKKLWLPSAPELQRDTLNGRTNVRKGLFAQWSFCWYEWQQMPSDVDKF